MGNSIIQQKSRDFAIRIIGLCRNLNINHTEYVLSKQILRSETSIGTNVRESINAQSRNDFSNKLNIALKEADETSYSLDMLNATGHINDEMFNSINKSSSSLLQ